MAVRMSRLDAPDPGVAAGRIEDLPFSNNGYWKGSAMFHKDKCNECGDCLEFCPYNRYDENSARQEIAKLIRGGTTPILGSCITCGACNQVCPTQANPFDLINERQEQIGALGIPNEAFERFAKLHDLPVKIEMGDPGRPVLNLCIVGAMVREQIQGPLFKGLTIVEGADYFCGVGYIHLGKPSMTARQAQPFIDKLSGLKAAEVVCFHDDCYAMLTSLAAQYQLSVPFRPVHLFEYLYAALSSLTERITSVGMRVAYQAPCASRYTPEKDYFLDKLFELVGVERVKREYEGLKGLCCGAPLMATDKQRAMEVKLRNISDARENGAEAMVFLCPMCFLNLRKLCQESGMKPIFITELCSQSLIEKE
ncbi:MAG: (Fe-S)-binding protein [Syntrophobacteraceae bacterium]